LYDLAATIKPLQQAPIQTGLNSEHFIAVRFGLCRDDGGRFTLLQIFQARALNHQ